MKAKNALGKDLTSKISIKVKKPGEDAYKEYKEKELKFTKLGKYKVEYKVTNPSNNKVAKKVVTFTCEDTKEPIIEGVKDIVVSKGTEYDILEGISAKAVSGKTLTDKIKYVVKRSDGTEIIVFNNILDCTELAEYTITYSVTNDYGIKASKTMTLFVVETLVSEVTDDVEQESSLGE